MIADISPHTLLRFRKPGSYVGTEKNIVIKKWKDERLKVCLVFPDLYEIGIANNAIRILYYLLNKEDDILAERVYLPYPDFAEYLSAEKQPLFSLETAHSLSDFDIIAFTLPYELCYTNILKIMDLSGITLNSDTRKTPIIMAGGSGALNPKPLSEFIDLFYIGEAEPSIVPLLKDINEMKYKGKSYILKKLAKYDFLYIPKVREEAKIKKSASYFMPLDYYDKYLMPRLKSVHNRGVIELLRGCPNNCRFCLGGYYFRPAREASPDMVIKAARRLILQNGYEEISLTSLSTMDYHCINELLQFLNEDFSMQKISVSVSSMRADKFSVDIAKQIGQVRLTGLTFAPETGSDELRLLINKKIKNEDVYESVRSAAAAGFFKIKLYFMIGLPQESQKDMASICEMAENVNKILRAHSRRASVIITVSNFVPKAHTAFQFVKQAGVAELKEKRRFIINRLKRSRNITIRFHDAESSVIEGLISRGDERIGDLILNAYKKGAYLDQWKDSFNFSIWRSAVADLKIDVTKYLQGSWPEGGVPWRGIDIGITERYYASEEQSFKNKRYSAGCFENCSRCENCGVSAKLNFVHECKIKMPHLKWARTSEHASVFRLKISKTGVLRYLSHNDYLTSIKRYLRSAGIIFSFSNGFHPHEKISVGAPGILGIESLCEYIDITCFETRAGLLNKIKNTKDDIEVLALSQIEVKESLFKLRKYEGYLLNKKIKIDKPFDIFQIGGKFLYIFDEAVVKEVRQTFIEYLISDSSLDVIRYEQYKGSNKGKYLSIL